MKEMSKKELQQVEGGLFLMLLAFSIGYFLGDLISGKELQQ